MTDPSLFETLDYYFAFVPITLQKITLEAELAGSILYTQVVSSIHDYENSNMDVFLFKD